MPTTTLKLPDDLKKQLARNARESGKSTHAYMVDALREKTEYDARRREFVQAAVKSRAEFEKTGLGYAMEDVHKYILAKAQGLPARRPRLKKWPR